MLSLSDFEKLVNIDRNQEIIEKRNQILPKIDKTDRKIFFTTYRNRIFHFLISSYLTDKEKLNFLYLNSFTLKNLKQILDKSTYKIINEILMEFYVSGYSYYELVGKIGLIKRIEYTYGKREDFYLILNLLAKWVNGLYLERKSNNSKIVNKISFLSSEDISFSTTKNLFFLFTVARNSTLEAIDLSNSSLNVNSLKYFKYAFKKEKPIYSLNLENNQITGHMAMEYFTSSFEHFKHLKYLNISNNSMNKEDAEFLSNHLNKFFTLEVIIFDNNPITSTGARILLYSFSKLGKLKKFSFRNCEIDKNFAEPLGSFLKIKEIESVDLSENRFLKNGFANKFAFFLPDVKLRNLDLDKCDLNQDDMIFILNGIKKNKNVEFLNLNRNDNCPEIVKKISEIINNQNFNRKIYYFGIRYPKKKRGMEIK